MSNHDFAHIQAWKYHRLLQGCRDDVDVGDFFFVFWKGDTKVSTTFEVSFYLCGGSVPSTMKVEVIATYTTISGTLLYNNIILLFKYNLGSL